MRGYRAARSYRNWRALYTPSMLLTKTSGLPSLDSWGLDTMRSSLEIPSVAKRVAYFYCFQVDHRQQRPCFRAIMHKHNSLTAILLRQTRESDMTTSLFHIQLANSVRNWAFCHPLQVSDPVTAALSSQFAEIWFSACSAREVTIGHTEANTLANPRTVTLPKHGLKLV